MSFNQTSIQSKIAYASNWVVHDLPECPALMQLVRQSLRAVGIHRQAEVLPPTRLGPSGAKCRLGGGGGNYPSNTGNNTVRGGGLGDDYDVALHLSISIFHTVVRRLITHRARTHGIDGKKWHENAGHIA